MNAYIPGREHLVRALVVMTFLANFAIAHADNANCKQQEEDGLQNSKASLVIPQIAPCYGAAGEDHSFTQEIRALVDNSPSGSSLALALQKLATRVQDDDLYGNSTPRDKYATLARQAAKDVNRGVGPGTQTTAVTDWNVQAGAVRAIPEVNVIDILDGACPTKMDVAKQACQDAMNKAKAWLRVFQLTERTLTQYSAAALEAIRERSTARLAMWHAYRDEALPQFQWEWLLNSWRLEKADKGPDGRARNIDDGQPIGPMAVPTDQIIFLHPGVGLEYRYKADKAAADDKSKISPIIYLEILGRYRWSWNEKTGTMIGGNGVSLVATYADRGKDTKVGYGLMFHSRQSKQYALGITRSGDATNIVLNVDLAEFFKDKLGYWNGIESEAQK